MHHTYRDRFEALPPVTDNFDSFIAVSDMFHAIVAEQKNEQVQAMYDEGPFKLHESVLELKERSEGRWRHLIAKKKTEKLEQCFTPGLSRQVVHTLNRTTLFLANNVVQTKPSLSKRIRSYRTR